MAPLYRCQHVPRPLHSAFFRISISCAALFCLLPALAFAQTYGPNVIPAGNFEGVNPTYVPWAGVDASNNIHGLDGAQIAVDDAGGIHSQKFGPSVAVCDLNGDGKPDLVVADSEGFFWFFPNSGTPQKPAFTQGEVIPIWLGEQSVTKSIDGVDNVVRIEGVDNVVPRIQLVDFDHNKHFDVLAGTYAGKLFRIHNIGSNTQPNFKPTYNPDTQMINTRKRGVLWCNYLAPCLTNMFGAADSLNLIMGEGTYSANSIYLLRNTGSSGSPSFDEDHREKIIPGMGLEQLTPLVLDWNNDGKPDILTGDRTGYLTLYLNNSTDPEHPTFAPGTHVKVGGVEKLGSATTVTLGDLTNNGLPNLLIGRDDGTIVYALNTGKLGAPDFSTVATPIKGVIPPDYRYTAPTLWHKIGAWGAPNELLACVNPQLEPGFTFPDGVQSKYALKFFVWPVKNILFPERYYPQIEDYWREHVLQCAPSVTIKFDTTYRLHCWMKLDGNISDLRYKFYSNRTRKAGATAPDTMVSISASSTWTEVTSTIRIKNLNPASVPSWDYGFEFRFVGQGMLYIDDLQIQEKL